ncbi:beta-ketoacyl-ACP synthase III [Legionella micdadei]|uniref:Beta-ketoacyl-[acyl-carrier-protein] synthase III n=1 Tax=Legionella micdadei TaxID=451 RepID=A0A098GEY4_LEGMI|nr:beta-ketoacyl-ACP synthase III [Legionella micdadei]ARG97482.1 ketoacyl-ACP synthase III [Legionella micdadei]ARH00208.1 ketoacyl-ACP synthase III [Legionella micdadei]KTD28379.1 3-oxoacyl-ACP synthase [Legionella micdadei]NSL17006.1 ketoacyl-ACP synthase III [Legionella micdadei]CEG61029.1 3-oxoacyl-[acyl-carrier-protein] synthase 3 [Legionella micdadei]
MKNAVINGTGSYLPERIVTNKDLESSLDTSHEWILSRTGISSRRIASEHETTSYMACQAAARAIEASDIVADDLDLILVATCTPNHMFPSMACHVQKSLNITKPIPAFDISAACSGFVYTMDVARQYINTGSAKHVLVIGSESMSRALDWTDRSTCVLFGDGAGAVVLSASDKPGILASTLHAMHDQEGYLTYPNYTNLDQRAFIGMRGNEVFKLAVNIMGDVVDEILQSCHLQKSDINWLIPHQANLRIIQAIAKKLNLPMSQVIVTIEHQGNTSAASIPLALDYSIRENRIKRGDLLLMESFGAGMTWGAMVIRY